MRFTRPRPIAWIRKRFAKPERSTAQYDRLLEAYESGRLSPPQSEIAAVALQTFGFNLRLEAKIRRKGIENRVLYLVAVLLACGGLWGINEIDQAKSDNLVNTRNSQVAGCDRTNDLRRALAAAVPALADLDQIPCRKVYPPVNR